MLLIIIFLALGFFYYSAITVVKEEIVKEETIKDEEEIKKVTKEIKLHFNTNYVKYNFHDINTFNSQVATDLYTKLVVRTLWIEEPYHSTFVNILQIIDQTESWVKSNRTKKIKLKIRQRNGTFQKGISFKVYSLSSLSFEFANRVLSYFTRNRSTKINIQTTIFAALLYHIDKIQELQHICFADLDAKFIKRCLVEKILAKYEYKDEVISLLQKMENGDDSVSYMLNIYINIIKFEREYPFVEKKKQDIKMIEFYALLGQEDKHLISLDCFDV